MKKGLLKYLDNMVELVEFDDNGGEGDFEMLKNLWHLMNIVQQCDEEMIEKCDPTNDQTMNMFEIG